MKILIPKMMRLRTPFSFIRRLLGHDLIHVKILMDIHVFGQIDFHSWWILSTSYQKTKDLRGKNLGRVDKKSPFIKLMCIYI